MKKLLVAIFVCIITMQAPPSYADYAQGCDDPEYHHYIEGRFAQFEARNRRLLERTLRDYFSSLSTNANPYLVIADLSRHLRYSAQFDELNIIAAKIDRIFEHADELSIAQQIAGDVVDSFSSETHSVGITRAWVAYRQGNHERAFDELLNSIDVTDSALLSTFGPDFEFVRHIYRHGHVDPVVAYINKTRGFWTGKHADEMRSVWLRMIAAKCRIQFDSDDKTQAQELGLGVIDIDKMLGLG